MRRAGIWAIVAVAILIFMGCASQKANMNYLAYLEAYQKQMAAHSPTVQLFSLTAKPGENIVLQGVNEIRVAMPAPPVAPPQMLVEQPSPAWDVVKTAIATAGNVAGIGLVVNGVGGMFDSLAKAAGHNTSYSYSQSVAGQGNTAQLRTIHAGDITQIGTGHVAGSITDNTGTPTVVEQPAPIIVPPSYPPTSP